MFCRDVQFDFYGNVTFNTDLKAHLHAWFHIKVVYFWEKIFCYMKPSSLISMTGVKVYLRWDCSLKTHAVNTCSDILGQKYRIKT